MNRDIFIKNLTGDQIEMSPKGRCANELTVEEFARETFNENQEGYWHNWTQMFETTFLRKDYFDKIYAKIMKYAPCCEGQRFLANNNTFFVNMIVDDAGKANCADCTRVFPEHLLCKAVFGCRRR